MRYLYEKGWDEKIGFLWVIPLFCILLGMRSLIISDKLLPLLGSIILLLIFFIIEIIYPAKEYMILIDEDGNKTKTFVSTRTDE